MRGEHTEQLGSVTLPKGSSPHARGAPIQTCIHEFVIGIIPACAGSTCINAAGQAGMRDHPRMRGEHRHGLSLWWRLLGSSPHARGARAAPPSVSASRRIIPACAGSTTARLS